MTFEGVLQLLLSLSIVGLGLYFRAYLKKKAENLATKEDVAAITKQVELIKGEIGSQLYVHQTRYQNEFQILKDLAEKVVEVKNSALSMRPVIDSFDPSESEEERKKKRLQRYFDAGRDFYKLFETRKPFYPDEIYVGVTKLDKVIWKEVVGYKNWSPNAGRGYDPKYWEKAAENSKEISAIADEVMCLIRKRIQYWEKFSIEQ